MGVKFWFKFASVLVSLLNAAAGFLSDAQKETITRKICEAENLKDDIAKIQNAKVAGAAVAAGITQSGDVFKPDPHARH